MTPNLRFGAAEHRDGRPNLRFGAAERRDGRPNLRLGTVRRHTRSCYEVGSTPFQSSSNARLS
jgi:hypothetical protein